MSQAGQISAIPLGPRGIALRSSLHFRGVPGGLLFDLGARGAGGLQGLVSGRIAAGRQQPPVGAGVTAAPGSAALLSEALGPGHHASRGPAASESGSLLTANGDASWSASACFASASGNAALLSCYR